MIIGASECRFQPVTRISIFGRFNEEDAHIARQATIEANTGLEVLDTRFDNNITDDSR